MSAPIECRHAWTQSRAGEKGSWCMDCEIKVWDVETRPCAGCIHFKPIFGGSVCKHWGGIVSPSMLATFAIAKGTCYTPAETTTPEESPHGR